MGGARAVRRRRRQQGPKTDFGWEVWPDALYDMLMRITRDYDRPSIEITENGCSYVDAPDARGVIHDTRRIDFYRGYLEALARAIDDGADVRGYHAWTLLDNFEWAEGYEQRFGLVWVDFATGERTIKESGALVRARRRRERLRPGGRGHRGLAALARTLSEQLDARAQRFDVAVAEQADDAPTARRRALGAAQRGCARRAGPRAGSRAARRSRRRRFSHRVAKMLCSSISSSTRRMSTSRSTGST